MQTELQLQPRASPGLLCYLLVAHGVGVAITWSVPLPWTLALSALLLASFVHAGLAQHWRRYPWRVEALRCHADFTVAACCGGQWQLCTVGTQSYLGTRLLILRLHAPAWRWPRTVILLPDNVDARLLRQLRIWLRWGYARRPEDQVEPFALPGSPGRDSGR